MDLPRKRGLAYTVTIGLAVLAAARDSKAGNPSFAAQLDYVATSGCPPVEVFESIVEGRLGYNPFRADAPNRVAVSVAANGHALEGRFEWRNTSGGSIGEQTFPSRSGDCRELTRAMGFALAVEIQVMAATGLESSLAPSAPPSPSTAATEASGPRTLSVPTLTPVTPSESRTPGSSETRSPWVLVGTGVSAGFGLAADRVALGRLFVAAEWPHVAIELGGEVIVPTTTDRQDGAGFSQQELLASVATCGVHLPWTACALAKIGELRVTGHGVNVPLSASGLMAQTGLRLAASHGLGHRAYIGARIEGLTRLTPNTVTLDAMPAWIMPRFAAVLGIDIGLRFR